MRCSHVPSGMRERRDDVLPGHSRHTPALPSEEEGDPDTCVFLQPHVCSEPHWQGFCQTVRRRPPGPKEMSLSQRVEVSPGKEHVTSGPTSDPHRGAHHACVHSPSQTPTEHYSMPDAIHSPRGFGLQPSPMQSLFPHSAIH